MRSFRSRIGAWVWLCSLRGHSAGQKNSGCSPTVMLQWPQGSDCDYCNDSFVLMCNTAQYCSTCLWQCFSVCNKKEHVLCSLTIILRHMWMTAWLPLQYMTQCRWMKVTANRTGMSCCFQERLRGNAFPVALSQNADAALVYIILIKHHRSLTICCVLTTTTVWLTKSTGAQPHWEDTAHTKDIQTLVHGNKKYVVSHTASQQGEFFHPEWQGKKKSPRASDKLLHVQVRNHIF